MAEVAWRFVGAVLVVGLLCCGSAGGQRDGETYRRLWSDSEVENRIARNIEQYRKSDVSIELIDARGRALGEVDVAIEQVSHDFLFGCNLFVLGQLETAEANAKYEAAFLRLFNSATIPFYWLGTEPTRGQLRYEEGSAYLWRRPPADRLVAWCRQHDVVPKGHPLLWHAHNPEWLPTEAEVVKGLFVERFRQISDRYGDSITLWDGVNEPVDCVRDFSLYSANRDYVAWAFREQRKVFPPQARLMINEMPHVCHEYNSQDPTQTRYYSHIRGLLGQGVRLDGIGFQFHIMSDRAIGEILAGQSYTPRRLLEVYELYDRFEMPMYVTEITIPTLADTETAATFQDEMVRNCYRLWFSVPRMKGITWWNLGDGTAIANENRFQGGLLDENLEAKPSYRALDHLINREWKTNVSCKTTAEGRVAFRGFHGRYRVTVKTPGITRRREIHVQDDTPNRFKLAIW